MGMPIVVDHQLAASNYNRIQKMLEKKIAYYERNGPDAATIVNLARATGIQLNYTPPMDAFQRNRFHP